MNLYEISNISNLTLFKNAVAKGLKMCHIDGETSPELDALYGNKHRFISHENVLLETRVTSVVILDDSKEKEERWTWDFKDKISITYNKDGSPRVTGGGDDRKMMKAIRDRLEDFDLVIAQNGDRFDLPVFQERLAILGLPPLRNIITLDTLKLSRRSFRTHSHSLDAQAKKLGFGGKDKQDMSDAIATMLNHPEKSKIRLDYNARDVHLLKKIFWRLCDYYNFSQMTINMLKLFLKDDKIYCVKCAARRQKKFGVEVVYGLVWNEGRSNEYKEKGLRCKNCFHQFKIKAGQDVSKLKIGK